MGKIYVLAKGIFEPPPLVLFIFDDEPNDGSLHDRIAALAAEGGISAETKIYAVFDSGHSDHERFVQVAQHRVDVWPHRALLRKGLKLSSYARDLVKRFDNDVLGGTGATLEDTFVEAHVHERGRRERKELKQVLSEWLSDPSRRHMAITGEYGQGKSTSMLAFCVEWARSYLKGDPIPGRIPLLIELRGQCPGETDDNLTFLSGWAARYGIAPKQLYTLIQSGDAIIIFEGFDELRNAGRAYDRHQHFNALWSMAYPGTKLIFTGRPNFFLDEREKNRTLRSDVFSSPAGTAFTQLWEMEHLTEDEIAKVVAGFGEELGKSILDAARQHPAFLHIVSRPSMLPVVATIWSSIQRYQAQGKDLSSAVLIEHYLQATYRRKEEELRRFGSDSVGYLLLPREVREVFTLAVVWKMASSDARNTIDRTSFDAVVAQLYDDVLQMFQTNGTPPDLARAVRDFEEKFREETKADRIERVSSAVASAGLFVSDPAGGASNLRLPHKQFHEYLIAKAAWILTVHGKSLTARAIYSIERGSPFKRLCMEEQSLVFFSELIGSNFSAFKKFSLFVRIFVSYSAANIKENIIKLTKQTIFARWISEQKYSSALYWDSEVEGLHYRDFFLAVVGMMSGIFAYLGLIVVTPVSDHALVFIGGVISILCVSTLAYGMLMLRATFSGYISNPRRLALLRIVAGRLIGSSASGVVRVPSVQPYRQCLLVLASPTLALDRVSLIRSTQAVDDVRDVVTPLA